MLNSSEIKILKNNPYACIPEKSTQHAVGFDIKACLYDFCKEEWDQTKQTEKEFEEYLNSYQITLKKGETIAVPTGLSLELPIDVEMAIKSRSGLFFRNAILAEGTIDPDYRGEVKIMLINLGKEDFIIKHHDRIAQALFRVVLNKDSLFKVVSHSDELSSTKRDTGGFGSTGI